MSTIPSGFEPHTRSSPVTDPWQPILARHEPGGLVRLGFVAARQHCNGRGLVHGGVLAALADNAMGLSLVALAQQAGEARAGFVTTGLSIDYLAMAQPPNWIEITPRVLKGTGRSGVVDALITADGALIARASASFRKIDLESRQ